MKLAKRRSLHSHIVHVVDLDNSDQPVCGLTSPWTIDPEWIDRLSIGCPGCRTFVTDWILGRDVPTVPRGWGKNQ